MVHVNYLAVLVAAVAVFVLGWLWYSPLLFYKPWMRLRGMDPVAAMAGAKMPGGKLLIELVRCLVLAYVIARFVALLGVSGGLGAVHFGLSLWAGVPGIPCAGSPGARPPRGSRSAPRRAPARRPDEPRRAAAGRLPP